MVNPKIILTFVMPERTTQGKGKGLQSRGRRVPTEVNAKPSKRFALPRRENNASKGEQTPRGQRGRKHAEMRVFFFAFLVFFAILDNIKQPDSGYPPYVHRAVISKNQLFTRVLSGLLFVNIT